MLGEFRSRRPGLARALAALALLAMAVRALVPAGYMLSPELAGGASIVTLCTAHGPVDVVVDDIGGGGHNQDGDKLNPDTPCAFAAIAQIAPPQAPPAIQAPSFPTAPTAFSIAHARPGLGLAAPPPWSTGPPISA